MLGLGKKTLAAATRAGEWALNQLFEPSAMVGDWFVRTFLTSRKTSTSESSR